MTESVKNWQFGFQVPNSPVMEGILNFHHDLFFFLVCILFFVVYLLFRVIIIFNKDNNKEVYLFTHAPMLEIIWTIIPALILILIAIPSFSLLYSLDEVVEPIFTIKVIGHQWFWSYEYTDPNLIYQMYYDSSDVEDKELLHIDVDAFYDSYILDDESVSNMEHRLLEVDNAVYLPTECNIRILVASTDVIHAWAVPALGVKIDACPGRLNQTSVFIKRPGLFFGQCSEICGENHGFMPIAVDAYPFFANGLALDIHTMETLLPLYSIMCGIKRNS